MSHIFLVKDSAGSYLVHHGKPGQKWGERHGPPYPLSRQSETERKELKPGSKVLQGKEITNRRTLKKKSLEKAAKFRDKKISKLEKKRDRLHDYNVDERKAINKEIQKYKKMSLEEVDEKRKNAGKEFIQNLLANSTKGQKWGVRNVPSDTTKQDIYKKEYEAGRQKFIEEYEKIRNTAKSDEEKDRRIRKLEDKWKEEGTKLLNKIDDPEYNKFKGKDDTKFNGLAFKDSQDFRKQLKDRNLSDDDMKEYSNNKDAILKSLTGRGEKDPELAKEYKKYMKENGKLLDGAVGAMIRTETFAEKKALEMLDKKKDTKFGGKEFIVNALRKADEKMGETRSIWYLNKEDRKALNKNMRDDYDRLEDIYYSKKEKDPKFEKYVKETYGVESSDKLKGENLDYAIEDYSYNTNYDKLRSKVDKDYVPTKEDQSYQLEPKYDMIGQKWGVRNVSKFGGKRK